MNKVRMRALIMKEVEASNLPELTKCLLEELLDSEKVQNEEKPVTIVRVAKRKAKTAPELPSLPSKGKGKSTKGGRPAGALGVKVLKGISAVKKQLDAGKELTSKGVMRVAGCGICRADRIIDHIVEMKGYHIRKGRGGKRVLFKGEAVKVSPTLAHHEPPMHHKTAYNKFMGEKLYYYQKKMGMNAKDAFNASVADWNKSKGAGVSTAKSFPDFKSVRSELKPIIIGILERLAKRGVGIDYKGISYALDIRSEKEYQRFIEEVIEHWDEIRAYFGVSANLKWNGAVLKLNG